MTLVYPHDPGYQRHSETSRMAAENLIDADGQIADVVKAFKDAGENGLTCDEATQIVREFRPMIENGTIAARMSRLKAEGVIYQKGEKRKTSRGHPAEVWVHIDHANMEHVEFTLKSLSSKRNLKRDTLAIVADFLKECVDRKAFAMPLLYERQAGELEQRVRKIIKDLAK